MSHFVPDFDLEENYSLHTSSAITRPKMSAMGEDDIMELVWHNGQVVMQSQAQRSYKKSDAPKFDDAVIPAGEHSSVREIRSSQDNYHQQQLFLQEEEMASWLHYPLQDNDFCADLLYPSSAACLISATPQPSSAAPFYYPNPSETRTPPPAARPPIPPSRKAEVAQNCSRRVSEGNSRGREATVVDSSDTPAGGVSESIGRCVVGNCSSDNTTTITPTAAVTTTNDNSNKTSNNNNMITCETTVTSSPGGSTATADDRKRKGREEDVECHSEDADFESAEAKKSARGSASTKRSRAAEVHNLSERRRRDRINEKMRALQELIPRCNKSDKASMLDEAIEYLKSLQLQVQMMSMGCSMVPMMFPGVQQYMTPMGMGMGMGMGMNRPMMPFPNVLSSPSLPSPAAAAAAHLGPRFPMPAYQMPPVPSPDPSRIQASSQIDPMLSAMASHDPNQTRVPNFADPYQRYMSLHQMQVPMPQGQTMAPPSSSRPSTGEGPDTIDNHHTGT